MPELLRAAKALPMTPGLPLVADACVVVEAGRILDFGTYAAMRGAHQGPARDLGDVLLAPAVLNSHVHLEMTHLLGKTVPGRGFVPWVESLLAQPLYTPEPSAIRAELFRLEARGTAFVADISTRNAAQVAGILAESGLYFASFQEAIGAQVPEDPQTLVHSVRQAQECGRGILSAAGHALYSTGPELLGAAKALCRERGLPFSLHLAEHTDEDAILLTGKSPFLDLLKARGVLSDFTAPGARPVPLARELGLLDPGTLCVHCVTADADDVAGIAASGASVCLCPRSNAYIGVGEAPLAAFLAAGANVCLGTDGLCSNQDLDVYAELAWLGARHPGLLGLAQGLAFITVNPARFFGLSQRLGCLAPGREARFSIVPQSVQDVFS